MATRTLSPLDATFLYLESEATPMHIGSVGIFEGRPLTDARGQLRITELRRTIERRLRHLPDLRRRVEPGPFGQLAPMWVDDATFEIEHHVRRAALPGPGGDEELTELVARLYEIPLDPSRPLWELWFIEGLAGGRVALFEKMHHALVDGLAGVQVATMVLDLDRRPRRDGPSDTPWHPAPGPSAPAVLVRDAEHLGSLPWRVTRGAWDATRHPGRTARQVAEAADALRSIASSQTLAPRSSLNVPVGRSRRVVFMRTPFDELRAVAHHFDVTVNDVVLSAVGGGLQALFRARGESVRDRDQQVLVPVGLRPTGPALGNEVSVLFVRVPVGPGDPVERLRRVAACAGDRKAHHQAVGFGMLLSLLGILPQTALAGLAHTVHHQPFVNLVVTNVPGPPFPLYALGARMLEAYPIVPLGGNLSLGIAALSYDGQMGFGLLADRDACPDVDVVGVGMRRAIAELTAAAGVGAVGEAGTRPA